MWFNIYNKDYCMKYIGYSKTELGQRIYKFRWDLIRRYLTQGNLLDYGCGPNAFNEAGPDTITKYGYDINPECHKTEIPDIKWDAVTFWDSLEHIPNFYGVIQKLSPTYLFITCPNLEAVDGNITEWRHYRPKEHIYYFDRYSLSIILEDLGYSILEFNYTEGDIRNVYRPKDLITVVAKKV